MNFRVTADQVSSFQENGFLVIEDFLDEFELNTWREQVQAAVDSRLESRDSSKNGGAIPLTNSFGDDENYYSQVFLQCIKLADTHPGVRELMFDPRLGDLAGTLAGVDGIRIWHDQALFKQPFGNPTSWHLDNPYWSFSSPNSLSIWVALDDATLSNGCLYYLPGTHKSARYENCGIGENMAGLFKHYPEWKSISPVACPCRAGSAVLHNGLVAHGAGANMTNKPRRAMTCAYMPDGSVFNGERNILPQAYLDSLSIGQVLDDPDITPLIWRKGA